MKKKIIVTALALALTVSVFSGCGEQKNASEPTPAPVVSESPSPSPDGEGAASELDENTTPEGTLAASDANAGKPSSKPAAGTQTSKPSVQAPVVQTPSTQAPEASAKPAQTPAPTPTPVPSPSVSEVMDKMMGALDEDSTYHLAEMPEELYEGVYQINPSDYEEVLVYGTMMNVKANEIIVIKAKNQDNLEAAKEALTQRLDALDKQWRRYLPDQYELVQAGVVTTNGLYATLVVAEGGSRAVNAFKSAL